MISTLRRGLLVLLAALPLVANAVAAPSAHELVQDIVHDAGGQRESAAEFIDRERPFVFPKAVYDLEHDGQDDPASSVVADAERFALFGETVDILVGEREFAAEEQDFPRDLQP